MGGGVELVLHPSEKSAVRCWHRDCE